MSLSKNFLMVSKFNGKYTDSFQEGGVERVRKRGVLDFDLTKKPRIFLNTHNPKTPQYLMRTFSFW